MRANHDCCRALLLGLALLAGFARCGLADGTDTRRPNLVLILADDLGYGDLGCQGGKAVATPRLDRLAAEGVRFTEGYVTCPACAPSRLGLLSGAYQERFGLVWNSDRGRHRLPESQRLLPELLGDSGYITGLIGKWNIARDPAGIFDEVHDLLEWESDYFPDADGHYIGSGAVSGPGIRSSKKQYWKSPGAGEEYLPDRMGRHAVEFIERHREGPFFLYVAFNAVHSPWQAKSVDRDRLEGLPHEALRLYAAMTAALDENVGRILDALARHGLERDTLVVFMSDNGPALGGPRIEGWPADWPASLVVGSAGPLRGHKAELYEGGIRVPLLVRWPARIEGGRTIDEPVIALDVLPTFCDAAGAGLPEGSTCDGISLLPLLRGEACGSSNRPLFWKTHTASAVRQGDWKLLLSGPGRTAELYDLANDIDEAHNHAAGEPERVRELLETYQAWERTLPPAASTGAAARPAARASRGPGRE